MDVIDQADVEIHPIIKLTEKGFDCVVSCSSVLCLVTDLEVQQQTCGEFYRKRKVSFQSNCCLGLKYKCTTLLRGLIHGTNVQL